MKLHEFTDRFYAMGGIEQEGKKRRILTEAVTNVVKIECTVEPFNKCFIADGFDWEDTDTLWTAPGDIDNAKLFPEYGWEEELQEILDECTDGSFTVDDFIVHDHFEESLTEARNPENAEVNAIIRKHLGKKSKITKKEQAVLDKYGISRDEYGEFVGPNGKRLMAYGRKSFGGPEAPVKKGFYGGRGNTHFDWSADSRYVDGDEKSFDAVDYANYLTKEQPGEGGHPATNDALYNKSRYPGRDVYTPSDSENKSLRPYSDRYKTLKGNVENAEYRLESSKGSGWRKPMTDEEIEAEVDALRQRLKADQKRYSEWASEDQRAYDDAQKELDDFKKSVSRRRNESLNESAYDMRDGDLRDEFYSLIDGMDPAEIVDMVYWYLDDYALEDMIKDIKGGASYTNETEE